MKKTGGAPRAAEHMDFSAGLMAAALIVVIVAAFALGTVRHRRSQTDSASPKDVPTSAWILIVDDEKESRDTLALMLRVGGWRVEIAPTAEDALAMLHSASTPPNCLISDVVMPGMDGWSLAAALRKEFPGLPVIFVSGIEPQRPAESRTLPDDVPCLAKPLSRDALLSAVEPYKPLAA